MPPAFALSQDQTLRFIPFPSIKENKTNDPALLKFRSILPEEDDIMHKRNCNAFIRYIAATLDKHRNQSKRG